MLLDLKEDDLFNGVSLALGVKYLSKTDCSSRWPAKGCIFGAGGILVSLPVKMATKEGGTSEARNVHFIVDTGAPRKYMASSAADSIGGSGSRGEDQIDFFKAAINGIPLAVHQTPEKLCHFSGLNVLRADFLTKSHAVLRIDYGHIEVELDRELGALDTQFKL